MREKLAEAADERFVEPEPENFVRPVQSSGDRFLEKERVDAEAVAEAVADHVADPEAGRFGVFKRRCTPK